MRKRFIAVSAVLILVLLFVSVMPKINIVKAQTGRNNNDYDAANLYTTNWLTDSGETSAVNEAMNEIYGNLSVQYIYEYIPYYGWYWYGYVYGQLLNWGDLTTPAIVLGQIDSDNEYHWFSQVLYIGHGYIDGFYGYSTDPGNPNDPPANTYTYYYGSGSNNVLAQTQSSTSQQFVLNWVCWAGNTLWLVQTGQENLPADDWGAPYDWNPLYWNGQSNGADYCWIGFNGSSPWLDDYMTNSNMQYGTWLADFYWLAVCNGWEATTVLQALNMASYLAGYPNYASSCLATGYYYYYQYPPSGDYSGCMVIAGDPNEYLPATVEFYG